MKILTGAQTSPLRAVIYGPEGIGKTTLASRWPAPLFIDVEGGTKELAVARTEPPTSWTALTQFVGELTTDTRGYATVVIDTADWAEKLLRDQVCAEAGVRSLGDVDYGRLYQRVNTEWCRFLDSLTRLSERAHVVLLAHCQMVRAEVPEESGSYDRYELKLMNSFKTSNCAATKEWASLVLFVGYQTFVVEGKATGGKRICYSTHHACWDAKQRTGYDLPEKMELPADRLPDALAALVVRTAPGAKPAATATATAAAKARPTATAAATTAPNAPVDAAKPAVDAAKPAVDAAKPAEKPVATAEDRKPAEATAAPSAQASANPTAAAGLPFAGAAAQADIAAALRPRLEQILATAGATKDELTGELARKGIVPAGTTFEALNAATLQRVISKWDAVFHNIQGTRARAAATAATGSAS